MDVKGNIWDDGGKIIGRAEPLPDTKREVASSSLFEDFLDSVLNAKRTLYSKAESLASWLKGTQKDLKERRYVLYLRTYF